MRKKIHTIAMTVGDPAGVGPELVRKMMQLFSRKPQIKIIPIGLTAAEKISPGKLTPQSAKIAWSALEESFDLWKSGRVSAIVTAPIHKENMESIGFPFLGHTEFFAARCGVPDHDTVMAFYDKKISVALLSAHCSLREAIKRITPDRICKVTRELHRLLTIVGIKTPKLAVAGLNPHAGENGLMGNEETQIMRPALSRLKKSGLRVTGPLSPDTVFWEALQGQHDGIVAAYHDQGLIPFKLLAFHSGVNVTLGLPLIRTSPDHGTALNLAGKGKADFGSMKSATQLAIQLALHQTQHGARRP